MGSITSVSQSSGPSVGIMSKMQMSCSFSFSLVSLPSITFHDCISFALKQIRIVSDKFDDHLLKTDVSIVCGQDKFALPMVDAWLITAKFADRISDDKAHCVVNDFVFMVELATFHGSLFCNFQQLCSIFQWHCLAVGCSIFNTLSQAVFGCSLCVSPRSLKEILWMWIWIGVFEQYLL